MKDFVTFPDDALLTVKETAAYLRIGRDEVYEQVKQGKIPSVRFGRQYRVPFWGLRNLVSEKAGLGGYVPFERRVDLVCH